MSGGIVRVRVDDYISLRKEKFGFDRVPLPRSQQLSEAESLLNRVINPQMRPSSPRAAGHSPPH